MPRTIRQIRHSASRRFGDLWTGTLTSAASQGASALVDTSRVEDTNWFRNAYLYVDIDTQGEEHRVSASVSGTLTIASTLAEAHASGKLYELHKLASMDDYNDFITQAIQLAASEAVLTHLDYKDSPGIVFTADEFEYAIPTNFKYISEVWLDQSDAIYVRRIPLDQLSIVPGVQLKLRFPPWMSLVVGARARVLGQGVDQLPQSNDSHVVQLDEAFILKYVELQINRRIARTSEGPRGDNARGDIRTLAAELALLQESMTREHRALPGSLVVP